VGNISTNNDHRKNDTRIELPDSQSTDVALFVDRNLVGRWLAIATTLYRGRAGDYTLRYEGVTDLHQVDRINIDVKQVERAFEKRGVLSDEERRRREEEARVTKIKALVEQLSLYSYRGELKRALHTAIKRETDFYADSRQHNDVLEQREKALQDALDSTNSLTNSKALIGEVLEKELRSVRSSAEQEAATAAKSLGKRDAFAAALAALDRLDNVAMELQRAEASLLSAKTVEEVALAQAERERLWKEHAALSVEIAEKLLDSEIVTRLRFGGFQTYWERLEEYIAEISIAAPGKIGWGMSSAGFRARIIPEPEIDTSIWLPSLLPWPPPNASTRAVIGPEFFRDLREGHTLGDLNVILIEALVKAGYHGSSYFGVPYGFAIITRLEQTDEYGAPLDDDARWSAKIQLVKSFSIVGCLRALLTASPGYFRVITLVVSKEPFSSGDRMRLDTLERWSQTGLNVLPKKVQALPYTEDYRVTALIYEFEKKSELDQPEVLIPGRLSPVTHLARTRFAAYLL
jgi:hypothetical protein